MKYAVVIEDAGCNYSAYVPDLPGCVATGATVEACARALKRAGAAKVLVLALARVVRPLSANI